MHGCAQDPGRVLADRAHLLRLDRWPSSAAGPPVPLPDASDTRLVELGLEVDLALGRDARDGLGILGSNDGGAPPGRLNLTGEEVDSLHEHDSAASVDIEPERPIAGTVTNLAHPLAEDDVIRNEDVCEQAPTLVRHEFGRQSGSTDSPSNKLDVWIWCSVAWMMLLAAKPDSATSSMKSANVAPKRVAAGRRNHSQSASRSNACREVLTLV